MSDITKPVVIVSKCLGFAAADTTDRLSPIGGAVCAMGEARRETGCARTIPRLLLTVDFSRHAGLRIRV